MKKRACKHIVEKALMTVISLLLAFNLMDPTPAFAAEPETVANLAENAPPPPSNLNRATESELDLTQPSAADEDTQAQTNDSEQLPTEAEESDEAQEGEEGADPEEGAEAESDLEAAAEAAADLAAAEALLDPLAAEPANGFLVMSGDGKTITGFRYEAGLSPDRIIIPKQMTAGVDIEAIGASAFSGCGLKEVQFETGSAIKTIGSAAFSANQLTDLKLPDSVQTLGGSAFTYCQQLVNVDLSNLTALTVLPNYCFQNDTAMQSLQLPPNLTTIQYNALYGLNSLNGIKLPASVTTVDGPETFYNMKDNSVIDLSEFRVGQLTGAPWLASGSYVKYKESDNGEDNATPFVFDKTTGTIYGLKESYRNSANGSLDLVIPANITCTNGTTYPVEKLAPHAFSYRPARFVIKTVTFEANNNITVLPPYVFRSIGSLTKLDLDGLTALTTIQGSAIRDNRNLTELSLPASVTTLEASSILANEQLRKVTINSSLPLTIYSSADVAQGAIRQCPALTEIYLPNIAKGAVPGAPWGATRAKIVWKNDEETPPLEITEPGSDWLFSINTDGPTTCTITSYLKSPVPNIDLVVPGVISYGGKDYTVTRIGTSSWLNVIPNGSKLQSLTIPDSVTYIGSSAFNGVKYPTLNLGSGIKQIASSAFSSGSFTSLTLPQSIEIILESAFANNANLKGTLTIPGNVTDIRSNAFASTSYTEIRIKQYRNRATDGVYNDAELKYLASPSAVKDRAPFGVAAAANKVYFEDDPKPEYTHTIQLDTAANKVVITLSAKMNDGTPFTKIAQQDGSPAVSSVSIAATGTTTSTAKMEIPATRGNGDYSFEIQFGPGGRKLSTYTVKIDQFRKLVYDGNGATGAAPTDKNNYVQGYRLTTLASKGALARTGHTFVGWSTTQNAAFTTQAAANAACVSSVTFGAENQTLCAVWLANSYQVNFAPGTVGASDSPSGAFSATTPVSVLYGGATPAAPLASSMTAPTGYSFGGWNPVLATTVTATVTYAATWKPNKYQVVYAKNAADATGTMADGEATYDASFTLAENTFSRTGYTFAGWTTNADGSGTAYTNKQTITSFKNAATLTLYAKWAPADVTVTFYTNDDSTGTSAVHATGTQKYGAALTAPTPAKPSHKDNVVGDPFNWVFAGWYDLSDATVPQAKKYEPGSTKIDKTGTLDLYAAWADAPLLLFDENADDADLPDPEYWVFSGKTMADISAADIQSAIAGITPPTRPGYLFKGWSLTEDGSPITSSQAYEESEPDSLMMVLYAVWESKKGTDSSAGEVDYKLYLFADYVGKNNANNIAVGSAIDVPDYNSTLDSLLPAASPTKPGYNFLGWKVVDDEDSYAKTPYETSVQGNHTFSDLANDDEAVHLYLAAKWGEKSNFTVNYDLSGGSCLVQGVQQTTLAPKAGVKWTDSALLVEPTRTGWNFVGWKVTENGNSSVTHTDLPNTTYATLANSSDTASYVTVTAQWTQKEYTVIYDPGSDGQFSQVAHAGLHFGEPLPAPPATTSTNPLLGFLNWNMSWGTGITLPATVPDIPDSQSRTVTYTAQWEQLHQLNFHLNATDASRNGGLASIPVPYGAYLQALDAHLSNTAAHPPLRAGYRFAGWHLDAEGTTPLEATTTMPQNEHTLYAKWVKVHRVTYLAPEATDPAAVPSDATEYDTGASVNVRYDILPARSGYNFIGWAKTLSANAAEFSQSGLASFAIIADTTLYAVWKANDSGRDNPLLPGKEDDSVGSGSGNSNADSSHSVMPRAGDNPLPFALAILLFTSGAASIALAARRLRQRRRNR